MPSKQFRYWCYTNPQYLEKPMRFKENPEVRFAQWSLEQCPKTGTLHHQGYFQLKMKKTFAWVKKNIHETAHLKACKGSEIANDNYTSKEYTHIEGPFTYGEKEVQGGHKEELKRVAESIKTKGTKRTIQDEPELYLRWGKRLKELEDVLKQEEKIPEENITLFQWEIDTEKILQEKPKKRRIIWIWSEESNTGKSTFCDYITNKYEVLKASFDMKRTLYAYDNHQIIWFDCARTDPHNADFLAQIEKLSNQTKHLSEHYQPIMKLVIAHIVVCSNRPPPHHKLPSRLHEVLATSPFGTKIIDI